jgi:hypothetical protein
MLLQVWVRGRRKKTRARSPRLAGRRAQARVNGPPKSGPILAGARLPFVDLFYHFKSVRISRAEFWDS